ncbi:sulfotransferase family 2 domain-containing protein [Nocardioides sp.]|jgi:hypothetical protein|uniref:sulfotransferase family 2 domain-containing protein n=1 Tax=Nocardioides sp. TaxID=35761 RepID=UPI0031FF3C8B|nr:hypothetical protein [Nocardioides sp.]
MIISDCHRFLFVHVQKTGGSSIDRAVSAAVPDVRRIGALDRHATLGQILNHEPELRSFWTVGFVRNPWERMLSWHRMVERFVAGAEAGGPNHTRQLKRNPFLAEVAREFPDFESFVMRATDRFTRLRTPQVAYLTSRVRRADFIGRQESLDIDLRAVFARLDLPAPEVPQLNVDRQRPDYHDVYTPAMQRRVAELFERDLNAFGYEF